MFGSIKTAVHAGWADPLDEKGDCWMAKFDKMGEVQGTVIWKTIGAAVGAEKIGTDCRTMAI